MLFYESEVLRCLNFKVSRILAIDFLNYFAFDAAFNPKEKRYYYAKYLLNISYQNLKLRSISKSLLGFSIVYFVNRIFGKRSEWPLENSNNSPNVNQCRTKKTFCLKLHKNLKEYKLFQKEFQNNYITELNSLNRISAKQKNYKNVFPEIQFDASKVRKIAMDIFLGNYI